MHCRNLSSFFECFKKVPPPERIVLLVPEDAERIALFREILPSSFSLLSLGEDSFPLVLETLTPSLFVEESRYVYDGVEAFKKKEWSAFLEEMVAQTSFVLGARSKISLSSFPKDTLILDLLEEKPWEKKERVLQMLHKKVVGEDKEIAPLALSFFLERVGLDFALLEREMEKVLSFVGERRMILQEDIAKVVKGYSQDTLWQIAEKIIWEKEKLFPVEAPSYSAFSPLFRYHLLLGKKIASLLEEKVPMENWGKELPKMWPKMREKRKQEVERLGVIYFERGCNLLFALDLLARSSSQNEEVLFDRFRLELSQLQVV